MGDGEMTVGPKSLAIVVGVAVAMTFCGCQGWHREVQPLKQPLQTATPNVVPPVNAYGYLQQGPVFHSGQLVAPLMPTATEKLIELQAEITELKLSNVRFDERVKSLQEQITKKDKETEVVHKEFQVAEKELQDAHDDMAKLQNDLTKWRKDLDILHKQIQQHESKQSKAIDGIVSLLEEVVESYGAETPSPPATPIDRGARNQHAGLWYVWSGNALIRAPRISYVPSPGSPR
jgi:hypothetical protein